MGLFEHVSNVVIILPIISILADFLHKFCSGLDHEPDFRFSLPHDWRSHIAYDLTLHHADLGWYAFHYGHAA